MGAWAWDRGLEIVGFFVFEFATGLFRLVALGVNVLDRLAKRDPIRSRRGTKDGNGWFFLVVNSGIVWFYRMCGACAIVVAVVIEHGWELFYEHRCDGKKPSEPRYLLRIRVQSNTVVVEWYGIPWYRSVLDLRPFKSKAWYYENKVRTATTYYIKSHKSWSRKFRKPKVIQLRVGATIGKE